MTSANDFLSLRLSDFVFRFFVCLFVFKAGTTASPDTIPTKFQVLFTLMCLHQKPCLPTKTLCLPFQGAFREYFKGRYSSAQTFSDIKLTPL